jgi:hypothetical protein
VTKPIFYLSPGLINQELNLVLEGSPAEMRRHLRPNSHDQRRLVAYVLKRLRWLYTVMITDEKNLERSIGRAAHSYPPAQRLQVRDLIQEGLERLPAPTPMGRLAVPGQRVFEVF